MSNHPQLPWPHLRRLAREGRIPASVALLNKIQAGKRNLTEELSIEIHRATNGEIPCWLTRPDRWCPGQVPPCLLPMKATA